MKFKTQHLATAAIFESTTFHAHRQNVAPNFAFWIYTFYPDKSSRRRPLVQNQQSRGHHHLLRLRLVTVHPVAPAQFRPAQFHHLPN